MDCTNLFDEQWVRLTGSTRIVAMSKDPHTLFVYWEVAKERRELIARHFQSQWSDLPLALCVYDVTHRPFDGNHTPHIARHQVSPDADHAYITELAAGRSYLVDLATKTYAGRSFAILRASSVCLPPDGVSELPLDPAFKAVQTASPTWSHYPYEDVFDGYVVHETRRRTPWLKGI